MAILASADTEPAALDKRRGQRSLILVSCIVFAEPLTSTLLLPFVYFMVRDFDNELDLSIGFRVGIITSSFFFCQMCTTPLWGMFSDRFGRKLSFAIGLFGGAISMACFGLSQSLIWAVCSRSICGLLNGNIGIARTVIGELAVKYSFRPSKAFAALGIAGAFGYIVGPLIGGLLSNPAESIGLQGPGGIFSKFPYLLPCLISTLINIVTMIMITFGLEETNPHRNDFTYQADEISETTALLPADRAVDHKSKTSGGMFGSTKPGHVAVLITATISICLHTIMFEEVYSLFAASSLREGTGLSFRSRDIALSLAIPGPLILITQLYVFPILNSHVDTIRLWRMSAISFAIDYPLVSLVPLIENTQLRWIALVLTLCNRVATHVVGWTALNIITSRVVQPDRSGFITGLVQGSASFSRGTGPALGGVLWSWCKSNKSAAPFDFHLFFLTISLIAVVQWTVGYLLPRSAASAE